MPGFSCWNLSKIPCSCGFPCPLDCASTLSVTDARGVAPTPETATSAVADTAASAATVMAQRRRDDFVAVPGTYLLAVLGSVRLQSVRDRTRCGDARGRRRP